MIVEYVLDEEGGVDVIDPLGDLVLRDEKGESFTIENTFIDAWLLSFLETLINISIEHSIEVGVLEEQEHVSVVVTKNVMKFTYFGKTITSEAEKTIRAFKDVAKIFVAELSDHDDIDKNISVKRLKELMN